MFKHSIDNKRYHTLTYFYKEKFGKKIAKISLNGGFSCPNKDGTKGVGGCIYCSKYGSGDFAGKPQKSITEQFNDVRKIMDKKWKDTSYIAYFQANTNTYAPVNILKEKYEEALKQPNVVGLSIATRPDAITNECIEYLEELNKRTYLTIELGLQTISEETTKLINRGHTLKEFDDMYKILKDKGFNIVIHIINGLPGETKEDMLNTVRYVNSLKPQGIKIHMLHIIKNTRLADYYEETKFHVLTEKEYIDIVIDQLELLDEKICINRITGDPKIEDLIEPQWLTKKFCVLNDIDKEMVRRDTYQGIKAE